MFRSRFDFVVDLPLRKFPDVVPVRSYDSNIRNTVVVGSKNIQEFIDAPADECSIYSRINRFINGDIYALGGGDHKGVYTDISGMPTDINSIHKLVSDSNRLIKSLGLSDIPSLLDVLTKKVENNFSEQPASVSAPSSDISSEEA